LGNFFINCVNLMLNLNLSRKADSGL